MPEVKARASCPGQGGWTGWQKGINFSFTKTCIWNICLPNRKCQSASYHNLSNDLYMNQFSQNTNFFSTQWEEPHTTIFGLNWQIKAQQCYSLVLHKLSNCSNYDRMSVTVGNLNIDLKIWTRTFSVSFTQFRPKHLQ